MSTSDGHGKEPLTRKQLREIRLTGATPVITEEEASAAAPVAAPPVPRAAEPVDIAPAPVADESVDLGAAPLTRRQARAQERIRTASVPVIGSDDAATAQAKPEDAQAPAPAEPEIVSAVPVFAPTAAPAAPVADAAAPEAAKTAEPEPAKQKAEPEAKREADEIAAAPAEKPAEKPAAKKKAGKADKAAAKKDGKPTAKPAVAQTEQPVAEPAAQPAAAVSESAASDSSAPDDVAGDLVDLGVDAEAIEHTDDVAEHGERATVSPAFGQSVLADDSAPAAFTPSFDELVSAGDSTGSQHIAPSALIFNPPPGEGSLSGPVASTGEMLVTGSYELPAGLGSQGHAEGVADGKDVDAVLIDGELPPASSPTPIAASSAVSTIKPAGEVIRPPAPEKGNKLMLILAITAGGLALALAAALIFAFTMNVF